MENTKVKLFGPTETKELLEKQMNEFLTIVDSFYINDIQFNVCRNFLPNTSLGEYQQLWYGMVSYGEHNEKA